MTVKPQATLSCGDQDGGGPGPHRVLGGWTRVQCEQWRSGDCAVGWAALASGKGRTRTGCSTLTRSMEERHGLPHTLLRRPSTKRKTRSRFCWACSRIRVGGLPESWPPLHDWSLARFFLLQFSRAIPGDHFMSFIPVKRKKLADIWADCGNWDAVLASHFACFANEEHSNVKSI